MLTTQHTLREFTETLSPAAMLHAIDAVGDRSYPAACGSLQSLLFNICQSHPKALDLVNDYIARAPAPQPQREACGDILCQGLHPVTAI